MTDGLFNLILIKLNYINFALARFSIIIQFIIIIICLNVDVAQERTHNALIAGVENFQPSSLKRTDTKEKIVLPNAEGKIQLIPIN